MKPLLTVKETAQVLKCHVVTARKMVKNGTIPSLMVGKCYRVRAADLEAWLASR